MANLHLAAFSADVTPPLGSSLCGGWIQPALETSDPLRAVGLVLMGAEAPVVLLALDWTGLCNRSHLRFRERLARAAHTTPERVAIHCVHQHNAPFVDEDAAAIAKGVAGIPPLFDSAWLTETLAKLAAEVAAAQARTMKVTHFTLGQANVRQVASNRRLLGLDGKLAGWRGSKCLDPKLQALPEGLIDPRLRSLGFWSGSQPLATAHAYATHPMSYYGDGKISADFVGLARRRFEQEQGHPQLYFTGCAGDVAAGKHNDGTPAARARLTERMLEGMRAAASQAKRLEATDCTWTTRAAALPVREDLDSDALRAALVDVKRPLSERIPAAMRLAYAQRQKSQPILAGGLRFGSAAAFLSLPAECFIAFQLAAQRHHPFLLTAAYGDGGPWYVPTAEAWGQGGYEALRANVGPKAEELLHEAVRSVLAA